MAHLRWHTSDGTPQMAHFRIMERAASTATIPKAQEGAEFRKAFLHTHQHTNGLQTSADIPLLNITIKCL